MLYWRVHMKQRLKGKTALVTGASGGIGRDIAEELASRGANLVLVARSEEKLKKACTELKSAHTISATYTVADLSRQGAARDVCKTASADIDILVNNAGFGLYGYAIDLDDEKVQNMIDLDVKALVSLTKHCLPGMIHRGWGRILQLSSIAAFMPSPTYAAYGACKSFVHNYSIALNNELKGSGISCTCLEPGVTRTSFLEVAGQKPTLYQRLVMMKSGDVARRGVKAMLAKKARVLPGFINKLSIASTRLLPKSWQAAIARRLMT